MTFKSISKLFALQNIRVKFCALIHTLKDEGGGIKKPPQPGKQTYLGAIYPLKIVLSARHEI